MQGHKLHGILLIWLLGAGPAIAGSDKPIKSLDQELEEHEMARLAEVQADPANHLTDFITDGCSGGLSAGWTTLSKTIPIFKTKFGEHPPYEFCCVTHDRAYWRGETKDGYQQRLLADKALRQCVMSYGTEHRQEFAREFNLSEETIVNNFQIISGLMYYAVRAGGKPCSYLPWRWGYGWPDCPFIEPQNGKTHE